jgi:uncharacterized protein (TIGR03435 family)
MLVRRTVLLLTAALAIPSTYAQAPAVTVEPSEQIPAYEVASIRPWNGEGFGIPLRGYIQNAFGIPGNSIGWVIGPEWINSAKYVIRAKPPDSIRDAMQKMSPEDRIKEGRLMAQALLADRFKLKAHFETREMPLYELVPAKGGSKLKEDPDATKGAIAVGASRIRATAAPMHNLIDALESVPDIGGRIVIDKTGLTGRYDIALKWTPLQTATAGGESGTAPADAEGASLFTAIEEQLGLKLVSTKGPAQVLVIDHIEQPSEN